MNEIHLLRSEKLRSLRRDTRDRDTQEGHERQRQTGDRDTRETETQGVTHGVVVDCHSLIIRLTECEVVGHICTLNSKSHFLLDQRSERVYRSWAKMYIFTRSDTHNPNPKFELMSPTRQIIDRGPGPCSGTGHVHTRTKHDSRPNEESQKTKCLQFPHVQRQEVILRYQLFNLYNVYRPNETVEAAAVNFQ